MVKPAVQTKSKVGLLAEGKPVPLKGVAVEATIKDFCARVALTQSYRNDEPNPIEAVYVFPVDEAAAVCGFEALIDGVRVVGRVEERDRAFETYDEALAQGHGAYLLDQEKPDVFTASIGNIPSGKEVSIRITYVTECMAEGDDLRFVLPTTVSPRYAPAEDRTGVGRPPAEAVNPPLAWNVPYGLELTVQLDMPSAIRSVESPSHPVSLDLDGRRATVRLGGRESSLDRDFVLVVRCTEPHIARAWLEQSEKGTAVLVAFQPGFKVEDSPAEMIFVIDRSGSMGGESIAEAKNALQLCLCSLPQGSTFNLVGFGSTYEMLFPASRPYDQETLKQATFHIEQMDADLGGTEILPALKAVLEAELQPGLARQVFVLTDGEVSNTDAVISLVRRHSATARVFTFGIGAGASHHLVRGMARAGGGTAEFIYPGERVEEKVLRQLRNALAPALNDVRVEWGSLRVDQAPYRVPPVFAGGRLLVYGYVKERPKELGVDATLAAKGPNGDVSFQVLVDFGNPDTGNVITTLWARTKLRDLEEGASALHERKGSRQERKTSDLVQKEAVRIGTTFGLCSKWTSFVAVEEREDAVEGHIELRRVPVALTHGWGGLQGRVMSCPATPVAYRLCAEESAPMLADLDVAHLVQPTPKRRARSAIRPLDRLVKLQSADGSWDLTEELANLLGKPLAELETRLLEATGDPIESRRAWATALALIWLKVEASDSIQEWALLERKARRWLRGCKASLSTGKEWLDAAAEVF